MVAVLDDHQVGGCLGEAVDLVAVLAEGGDRHRAELGGSLERDGGTQWPPSDGYLGCPEVELLAAPVVRYLRLSEDPGERDLDGFLRDTLENIQVRSLKTLLEIHARELIDGGGRHQ